MCRLFYNVLSTTYRMKINFYYINKNLKFINIFHQTWFSMKTQQNLVTLLNKNVTKLANLTCFNNCFLFCNYDVDSKW